MGTIENQVQSACFKYLQLRGAFVWRNNTRTIMVPGKGGKPRPMFFGGCPGAPDIMGILPGGRFIGVECKKPLGPKGGHGGSVQTLDQQAWQNECERTGGLYVLARGVEDVEKMLNTEGAAGDE